MKVEAVSSDDFVSLAPLEPDHVSAEYQAWLEDPEVARYTEISGSQSLDSIRGYVEATLNSPTAAIWRILVDGTRHVGNIRLSNVRKPHGRAEVALIVGARDCWGRGVGSRAIDLVCRYAFDVLGLNKLTAGMVCANVGSYRAFEKAGFHCEAVLRDHAMFGGEKHDCIFMARFAERRPAGADGTPSRFLPYGRQSIDQADIAAVDEVLRGDWLTTGPAVERFEGALCGAVGAGHAVACANGTAALHLAMLALDLREGDAVVVPAVTFLATANAARYVGAEVVFADVNPSTGLMEPEHLSRALETDGAGNVKAAVPVHYAGQCADPVANAEVARRHALAIVEDAAHALGTTYCSPEGQVSVGACAHADMSVFSFHPVKTVTMGEGGAITTNDAGLAERLRRFRNHGMTRAAADFTNRELAFDGEQLVNPWYYEMPEPGFNYRASDIHCALGTSQLAKLDRYVDRRRELVQRYDSLLAELAPVVRPLDRSAGCQPGWHLYVVRVDFAETGFSRAEFMTRLREQGVGTQVHYIPVHMQPYYRARYGEIALPGSEEFYRSVLSLPLFPEMEAADVDRVVSAVGALVREGITAGT